MDTKKTTLTKMRPVTPTDDGTADRKQRERRAGKTQLAKHHHRGGGRAAHAPPRLDTSLSGGLLSRPWKRLFGVSTDVTLPR